MKQKRPPIVTVLGHVDHGKTTLLDALRKTRVAEREAGGITQGVGATTIDTPDGQITFLDTPGHEAFSAMRERGAKLADIAILVVAADDGPKPQTIEALNYIKQAKIPFIVAFTKTDLPSANVDAAMNKMMELEVLFEGLGGDTPFVKVSAKKNEGMQDLIEIIHLVAGVNEIEADPDGELLATVIETNKDKRGNVVLCVVKNGTLRSSEVVYAGSMEAKIRGIFDQDGKQVKEIKPGYPAAILGFNDLPEVGVNIMSTQGTSTARIKQDVPKVGEDQVAVILKVSSTGSIEAIKNILPKDVVVLRESVGDVTESDIFFAKPAGAVILAFEAKVPSSSKKLAETENVEVKAFRVIYELVDYLKEVLDSKTATVLGKADILASFPYNKQTVAGSRVTEGRIRKADNVQVLRGEKVIGTAKISSVRREKNVVDEAKVGEECGILLSPPVGFEIGDKIVAVK